MMVSVIIVIVVMPMIHCLRVPPKSFAPVLQRHMRPGKKPGEHQQRSDDSAGELHERI